MVRLHAIVLMRLTATPSAIVSPKTKLLNKQQLKRVSLVAGGWSKKFSTNVQPRRALQPQN